eukprot:TRINITY_DN8500_c0_g1_i1.p1 TRINITY_DN8500_c0_g1~~TRINITY_DN8500_c0_g1_i1.p1  ORF type:complete len:769 (-),score=154.72 TRINITY_DN8500_c0_g1_i1:53-2359(-)
MDRLIPVTNEIRDALATANLDLGIELPEIAVVGGQSVGKSSLLEALVGRAFLPTGAGVVTRRPLLLRLVHRSEDNAEWGEFGHLPGKRFENFDQIREEIKVETERMCGQQQVISAVPIVLQITSPKVITLTLIDLPGITKVPIGDQPEDIEVLIRQLVMDHISSPRCLILAVVAGNADLATADALALSREVDPDGERTIGVLTKLDLADHSASEAAQVLDGQIYPLRLGFIGVTCRSFRDVQQGKAIKDQLQSEEKFFRSHSAYRAVAQHCGINHLARRLNRLLLDRLCESLPAIRTQALQMCHTYELELQGYGQPLETQSPKDQGALLLSLFAKFAGRFGDAVEGKLSSQPLEVPGPLGQLVGRARIDFIFRDVFAKTIRDFDSFNGLSDDDIRIAVRNATGPRASLFVPEAAFEMLVRRQIVKLEAPSLQCADLVFDELQRVLLLSELPEFRRFVKLREQVFNVVRDILRRCLSPTTDMIRDLIGIELAYINTSHPEFVGFGAALRNAGSAASSPPPAAGRSGETGHLALNESMTEDAKPAPVAAPSAASLQSSPREGSASGTVGGGGFLSSALGFLRQPSTGRLLIGRSTSSEAVSPPSSANPGGKPRPSLGGGGYGNSNGTSASPAVSSHSGGPKLPHIPPSINPAATPAAPRERMEVNLIKTLMDNYLSLVKKNVADSVPKAIMFFLVSGHGVCGSDPAGVSSLKDAIQSECVTRLYKEDLFDTLLSEATDVQEKRGECQQRLDALRKVVQVSERVRDVLETL